ncbi:ABC transporter permease [Paludisphaera sp.]|uniref:ABC transporter permease n=1 Tax=Paludisphaera sp. TaxID=2017432 RepID=UPI00301D2C43
MTSPAPEARAISNLPSPGSLAAVVRITVARQLRGKRIWLFVLMFAMPTALAILVRRHAHLYVPDDSATALLHVLIPQAIVPLTALLFASSLVQDDVEEQTLTYFLIRPIPRWAIYVAKALGAVLTTSALAALFMTSTVAAIRWGVGGFGAPELAREAGVLTATSTLSMLAYISIFGLLGLLTKRVLVAGVGYVIFFEGFVSNIPFLIRHATVLFHARVLTVRWLGLDGGPWSIDPETAPAASVSLACLAVTSALFLALGAWLFSAREFRVKTPEGG